MSEPQNETALARQQEFNTWLAVFEQKLKAEKPFDLTDRAVGEFVSQIRGAFLKNVLPKSFSFEKYLDVIVSEAAEDCGLSVDDFPELESEHQQLLIIAQQVRAEIPQEHENLLDDDETLGFGEDITELKKAVLDYDTQGPGIPPEKLVTNSGTEEHIRRLRESIK